MNDATSPLSDDELDDIAAEWLCERAVGGSPAQEHAFTLWREQDPRHAAAIARVERTLALLDEMPAVRAPLEARLGGAHRALATEPARKWRRSALPLWR